MWLRSFKGSCITSSADVDGRAGVIMVQGSGTNLSGKGGVRCGIILKYRSQISYMPDSVHPGDKFTPAVADSRP